MKNLIATKKVQAKKRLQETGLDFKELIGESCIVREAKGGPPVIVYLELGEDLSALGNALRTIRYEKSGRTGGLPTISRTFGYAPRVVLRRDFCGSASLNAEEPRTYALIKDAARMAAQHYQRHAPVIYDRHMTDAGKVLPAYRIADTPFTSGIINRNNQLRYHFDSGNFKDVWSAMFVFKKGVSGGFLSCPEYGLGFELKNNSLLLFDGQSVLHGVTPITLLSPSSYRLSIVYYSLAGLWRCLSPQDEITRIRKVRTEREKRRASK